MSALAAAALATMAIVVQDNTALRAAPSATATTQAQLWQGDLVEVRGQRLDHLQVYDHQRERAGFVRSSQLRPLTFQDSDAPQLLAVLRFLRDTPGAESLGIAYAAAYLKAVPAQALTAEPFDALGSMAERLARRASAKALTGNVAAHLEVASRYGVKFNTYEREGAMRLCYDGEAFLRVLTMPATAEQQARAVLALTRHDCMDPTLPAHRKPAQDRWRADLLDRLGSAQFVQLDEPARNRVRLRRAGVWAAVAFARSREANGDAAGAARRAIDELAGVNKAELGDEELVDYAEAAIRVGASRAAALPLPVASTAARLAVQLQPGEPGQTCVQLNTGGSAAVARRCTFGTVWPATARPSPDGKALALQVQPLEGWTELWVFRAGTEGWTVDVLPPAASEPGLGYVEFAGYAPAASAKMLLAREARAEGRTRRSFEVLALDTLAVDKQASTPQLLAAFGKWQDVGWKRGTVALR